eukprot:766717-Hanusia_phi.AAC.1
MILHGKKRHGERKEPRKATCLEFSKTVLLSSFETLCHIRSLQSTSAATPTISASFPLSPSPPLSPTPPPSPPLSSTPPSPPLPHHKLIACPSHSDMDSPPLGQSNPPLLSSGISISKYPPFNYPTMLLALLVVNKPGHAAGPAGPVRRASPADSPGRAPATSRVQNARRSPGSVPGCPGAVPGGAAGPTGVAAPGSPAQRPQCRSDSHTRSGPGGPGSVTVESPARSTPYGMAHEHGIESVTAHGPGRHAAGRAPRRTAYFKAAQPEVGPVTGPRPAAAGPARHSGLARKHESGLLLRGCRRHRVTVPPRAGQDSLDGSTLAGRGHRQPTTPGVLPYRAYPPPVPASRRVVRPVTRGLYRAPGMVHGYRLAEYYGRLTGGSPSRAGPAPRGPPSEPVPPARGHIT